MKQPRERSSEVVKGIPGHLSNALRVPVTHTSPSQEMAWPSRCLLGPPTLESSLMLSVSHTPYPIL